MSGTTNPMFQPGIIPPGYAPAPNQLAPWSNWEGDAGIPSNDYWLEQARRLAANPNDYGQPEPLPGITSGAPPKPWGLDRTQLPNQPPPLRWIQQLGVSRPADYEIDPSMLMNTPTSVPTRLPMPTAFKVWRGGTARLPTTKATSPDTGEFWAERWRLPGAREQTD